MNLRPVFLILIAVIAASQVGCTEIRVFGGDRVQVSRWFGITSISVTSSTNPSFTEIKGAGVVMGANHLTIGWMKEQLAAFPDPGRCAVLIVENTPENVQKIERFLEVRGEDLTKVCVVGEGR